MNHLNIEIKARCADLEAARNALRACGARRQGLDRQRDTYFRVADGRLKLREGDIELSLIHYDREDKPGPKTSRVTLYRPAAEAEGGAPALRALLARALGVFTVVEKAREIWWLDNVKIHLDEVPGLGSFVEIEAIGRGEAPSPDRLRAQCEELMATLGVGAADLMTGSYSDLLPLRGDS